MGQSSSRNADQSASSPSSGPHMAWNSTNDDLPPQLTLPEPGEGGDEDEDVLHDLQTYGSPSPSAAAAYAAAYATDDGGYGVVPTADGFAAGSPADGSMPAWAAGGAADEQCSSSLELQFVYGVRGADCRRNTFFTASGEIAFHAASLVVLYDPRRHSQRFLRGHDAELRCLSLHPSGRVLASGQAAGGRTEICVWQLDATEPAIILSGQHPGGVGCLAFSPSGERLAAIGTDAMHTLVLWDWRRATPLAMQQTHAQPVLALAWSPVQAALATVGVSHVSLWGVDAEESGLTGRTAQLLPSSAGAASYDAGASNATQPSFLCCAFLRSGMLVAGTSRGEVWCWSGTALCARFKAHDGPVFCLEVERTEGWLLSGGKDARLRLWSPSVWPNAGARPATNDAFQPSPLRMVDLRKLAFALSDGAGRPRLLGTPCLRALHWVGTSILMSTRCGELLHLDYASSSEAPDVTLLLQGHCQIGTPPTALRPPDGRDPGGSRCALACHPSLPLLASAAPDLTLRLWDVQQRQMEGMRMLPAVAWDLAFAPTSDTLVVALGPSGLLMLDAASLHDLLTMPLGVGAGGACALAFAPDGAVLAVGTETGAVELRAAGGLWEALGTCGAHASPVTSIDWSDDGGSLQSNSLDGTLLFWDARTCAQLDPEAASSAVWSSASCPRQWALAGVPEVLGSHTLLAATQRSNGGAAVACAGLDGALTLVGYPSASPDAAALRYPDGCAALRALAWTCDDGVLLSLSETGELLQWRHLGGEPADTSAAAAAAAAADEAAYDSDVEHELSVAALPVGDGITVHAAPSAPYGVAGWADDITAATTAGTAGGGARVGSHHAELHAPSGYAEPPDAHEAPPDGLQLEWVYGCRGHDAHGCVKWTASGEVAFHAASVGAVYDPRAHTQRFFLGHSHDVLSLASHPSGLAIATGQAGTSALSCVWDARTCEPISVLRGVHSLGVCALAFDHSGERLATCGLEASHRVAVWDWRRGLLVARVATGAARIFALAFCPPPPFAPAASGPIELAAVGVRTAAFIAGRADAGAGVGGAYGVQLDDAGALLRCKRGLWGGRAPQATLLCALYSGDVSSGAECYTGTARGDILIWRERALVRAVAAHSGPVFCLAKAGGDVAASAGEGELLFSAGKGGKLRRWGAGLRPCGTIDLRDPLAALTDAWGRPLLSRGDSPAIRSLDIDAAGRLLLATSGGEVAVLVPSSGELSLLLQGHSARRGAKWPGKLNALATHPTKPLAATAGAEGALRLWSLSQHTLLAARPLPAAAAAAAFSPDGNYLAVGLADGGWLLLASDSLKPVDGAATAAAHAPMAERAARGAVGCIAFSPDGAMLAIGGADGGVTICAHVSGGWSGGWHRVASCVGHTSAVMQIDWSEEPVVLTSGPGSVGGGNATECWLLRTAAAPPPAAEAAAELLHWEMICEREGRAGLSAAAAAAAAGVIGFEGGGAAAVAASAAARAVSSAGARPVAHATAVRDVSWATDTCALCWGALGPALKAGLAISELESSEGATDGHGLRPVARSHEGEVLAASDARGGVSLWRWPAASTNSLCKRYGGHARPPAAIAFSHDDGLLLTCGGSDLTLLQWRHVTEEMGERLGGSHAADAAYDSDLAPDLIPVEALLHPPRHRGPEMATSRRAFLEASSLAQAARASGAELANALPAEPSPLGALSASTALMALDELVQKQRFHAVRPWLRGLEPPSANAGFAPPSERAPVESLELSWVHGARVADTRASVHITARGEILYPAAALVVLLTPPAPSASLTAPPSQQRYYKGHTAGVTAVTLHPNGTLVASAAVGTDPAIHIWDSASCNTLAALRGAHSGGVGALAFSTTADGALLASCDLAPSPLVALWDWRKGELLASARAGRQRVLGLAFSPKGALLSFGPGSLRFWTADGSKLTSRRGLYNGALAEGGGGRRAAARRAPSCASPSRPMARPSTLALPTAACRCGVRAAHARTSCRSTASSPSLPSTAPPSACSPRARAGACCGGRGRAQRAPRSSPLTPAPLTSLLCSAPPVTTPAVRWRT